jgi:hypothetical protein
LVVAKHYLRQLLTITKAVFFQLSHCQRNTYSHNHLHQGDTLSAK